MDKNSVSNYTDEMRAAAKAASKRLQEKLGVNVGSAWGYPGSFDKDPEPFLMVFSDDPIEVPEKFEGFTVAIRGIPRAF